MSPIGILLISCSVSLLLFQRADSAKLPADFGRCKISDSKFNDCLKTSFQDILPKLKPGVSSLGIPIMDPIEIPELVIGAGTGAVHLDQHYKEVKLTGLSISTVKKIEFDVKALKLYFELFTPTMALLAHYDINGKILVLPVTGTGPCNLTLFDVLSTHTLMGKLVEKKGKQYLQINDYKATLEPQNAYYRFDNLFNGDKVLGDQVHDVINGNWKEIFMDVKKGYEESFSIIFKDFSNRLFSKVPFYDIFLK